MLLLLLVFSAACRATVAAAHDPSPQATVSRSELIVVFPLTDRPAAAWPAPDVNSRFHYYEWRFGVGGVNGFTASASADESDPEAVDAHGSLAAVVRRAALRQCVPGGHILVCSQPIAGTVTDSGGHAVVTVREPSIVAGLWRDEPAYLWRTVFLPDTGLNDSVRLSYVR
jgi:hypothetical protein